jgi:hypothetical protein
MITTTSSSYTEDLRIRPPQMTPPDRLRQHMRAEFLEMPALMLTLPQAARLWCVTAPQATAALTELVDGGFLMRDQHGVYRRRGTCPRCS